MKVAKRAFKCAIKHLHPTRNVRDMVDQLPGINHFASSHCIHTNVLCSSANGTLQKELLNVLLSIFIQPEM
jgi:hypothetical protein